MSKFGPPWLRLHPEVAEALEAGRPLVALETALIAHGLPPPANLEVARELEAVVREEGAVPATVAVVGGIPTLGLTADQLEAVAAGAAVAKLSDRDLAPAIALGRDGATTVAGTLALAARAGIPVMATGGLGGVHRGAERSWDVSADLGVLRRERLLVVASGVKSVLDVGATLEQLETLGVPVIGYRSTRFAGFLISDSGWELSWSVDTPEQAAAVARVHWSLGERAGGLLLANPVDATDQLDPDLHRRALEEGLLRAEAEGIRGPRTTPYLLVHLERATGGLSAIVNRRLVVANARLAAQVAQALATPGAS